VTWPWGAVGIPNTHLQDLNLLFLSAMGQSGEPAPSPRRGQLCRSCEHRNWLRSKTRDKFLCQLLGFIIISENESFDKRVVPVTKILRYAIGRNALFMALENSCSLFFSKPFGWFPVAVAALPIFIFHILNVSLTVRSQG